MNPNSDAANARHKIDLKAIVERLVAQVLLRQLFLQDCFGTWRSVVVVLVDWGGRGSLAEA